MSIIATTTPKLSIRLDATGVILDTIEEWSIDEGYWESTDGWSVTLLTDTLRPRDLWMQPITLLLGDVPWMVGRIEVVTSDDNSRTINLSGRDYIADLVEGHVDPNFKITEKTTLADAILQACRPYGITTVLSDGDCPLRRIRSGSKAASKARRDLKSVQLDELQPKDGQGCYEFVNRLAARSGCTIQPDIRRNVLALSVPAYDSAPICEIRRSRDRVGGGANNVKTARCTRDGTHWPSVLRLTGGVPEKPATIADPKPPKTDGVTTNAGESVKRPQLGRMYRVYDTTTVAETFNPALGAQLAGKAVSGIRKASDGWPPAGQLYRIFRQSDDEVKTVEQLHALGARILGERLKSTLVYDVTVRGYADYKTGHFWTVDTIVNVRDEIADVDEPLWVESITRSWSRNGGATTKMKLIRPGVVRVDEEG